MAYNATLVSGTYNTTSQKFGAASITAPKVTLPSGAHGAGPVFTWDFWFKASAIPGNIAVLIGNAAGYVAIVNATGYLRYVGATGSVTLTGTTNVCDGNWHHVRVSGHANGVNVFLDGTKILSTTTAQPYAAAVSYIGSLNGSSFTFAGDIDEVSIWSKTLSMLENFTPPTAPWTGTEDGLNALYHNDNNVQDAVPDGTAKPVNSVAPVATPGVGIVGTTFTSSPGSWTQRPTSYAYQWFRTTTGKVADGVAISGATNASYAAVAADVGACLYCRVTATNGIGTTDAPANSNVSSSITANATTIAPDSPAIIHSPWNWDRTTPTRFKSICAGAYVRTLFKGSQITANFDVSALGNPKGRIAYRVDGPHGQWQFADLASSIVIAAPSDTSQFPYHTVEIVYDASTQKLSRWGGTLTAIVFLGFTLETGGAVVAPQRRLFNILIMGDSITEGVRKINQDDATTDTLSNSVIFSYAWRMAELLNAEVGIVACGSQGMTVTGAGGWPKFIDAWKLQYVGVARDFTRIPDLVILHAGTNDAGLSDADFTAANIAFLNDILTTLPTTRIVDMSLFSPKAQPASKFAAKKAAVAGCSDPARVAFVDTTGFQDNAMGVDTTLLHPTGANDQAFIGPRVANAVWPILAGIQQPLQVNGVLASDLLTMERNGVRVNAPLSDVKAYLAAA